MNFVKDMFEVNRSIYFILGILTAYGDYTACSESCQSNPATPPTKYRQRQCINNSFGGNCNNAPLRKTVQCNVGLGCICKCTFWSQNIIT